jgi:hypothetical protein
MHFVSVLVAGTSCALRWVAPRTGSEELKMGRPEVFPQDTYSSLTESTRSASVAHLNEVRPGIDGAGKPFGAPYAKVFAGIDDEDRMAALFETLISEKIRNFW